MKKEQKTITNANEGRQNKLNVPTLRFAEYTDEWHKFALSDFVTRITRRNKNNESSLPLTISAQYGLVDQITFFNKTVASVDLSGYYLLYNGDFAYNKSYSNDYAWGAVKRLDKYEKGCLSSLYFVFRPKDSVDSDYLTHYFETKKWHKGISDIAGEGARNHGLLNMAVDDYFATKHFLPAIDEQKKIAAFLNKIEKRIDIQNKIIEDLKILKKELCNKVFQSFQCVRLGDYIEEITTRNRSNYCDNVLSVSNKLGFVKQSEQFEDRTIASEDKRNYKVVTTGCFAYNPARINVGSIALLSSDTKGIISPMYVCFRAKDGLSAEYLNFYYQSVFFFKELQKRLEGSVRQCLTYENMCDMQIPFAKTERQEEVADTLKRFAYLIEREEKYLRLLQLQKAYFLNAMFI